MILEKILFNRTLSKTIVALTETDRIMKEIDGIKYFNKMGVYNE